MKEKLKKVEKELEILDKNLNFLVLNENDTKKFIKELYSSVLNLKSSFEDCCTKLAIYKENHIDKEEIYCKSKLDKDFINERIFLANLVKLAKEELGMNGYDELRITAENYCNKADLDIYVFKTSEIMIKKFEVLIKKCKEALK